MCRPGVAVVTVLGVLSVTLALCFVMVRSQMVSVQIERNADRREQARQAARTGLAFALRQMHSDDWAGVESPISRSLGEGQGFDVLFATGDEQLAPGDPDYDEYPYRVTVSSTGYAADPAAPTVRAEHRCEAVVQLVRKAVSPVPQAWSQYQHLTVAQWKYADTRLQLPLHVQGPMLLQGRVRLCERYPDDNDARDRYLTDLEKMRAAGLGDHRPLSGPLLAPLWKTPWSTLVTLSYRLNVQLVDTSLWGEEPFQHPGAVAHYRLYPGGKQYEAPLLQSQYGSRLANVSLAPDPRENPLGLFRSSGELKLRDNVQFRGTLITAGHQPDVEIEGRGVRLEAPALPPIEGRDDPLQLPLLLAGDDIRVESGADAEIRGFVGAWDDFEIERGSQSTVFDLRGKLLTGKFNAEGRHGWDIDDDDWEDLLDDFEEQLDEDDTPVPYFPQYVQQRRGFPYKPKLTIRPDDDESIEYHWPDFDQPIFLPHPDDDEDDDGEAELRWRVIRWSESA